MLNLQNIFDTIDMIDKQHLDIRTITMGISLLDCVSEDPKRCCDKIYDKICARAEHLVKTGEDIESEFGIPIVNKRISVTPIALIAGSCETEDYVPLCKDARPRSQDLRCELHRRLFRTRAEGLRQAATELLMRRHSARRWPRRISSARRVNVGSTKAGINMDAVARMGQHHQADGATSRVTTDGLGCAKLVVFCQRRGG